MEGAFNGLTRLYSPILGRTSASCEFEFYYYKKSSPNPRSTSLSLYLENTDLSKERLWRTEDNSVNSDWTRILVNLHSRAAGIRLYFEASHADQIGDNRPIIALDNINFLNCLTVYNTSCNLTNVFTCSASNCIPNSMVLKMFDSFDRSLMLYLIYNIIPVRFAITRKIAWKEKTNKVVTCISDVISSPSRIRFVIGAKTTIRT